MGEIKGYISQVIGPVVDIHFDYGTEETVTLPRIHDAMEISPPKRKDLDRRSSATHRGKHRPYRSDGYDRRIETRHGAVSYGMPITMPTGDQVKGRLMNVTGDLSMAWPSLLKTGSSHPS